MYVSDPLTGKQLSENRARKKYMVCFDGGGVKCLAEAQFYSEFLKNRKDFTPNILAGTSGGSIVAGALAIGKSPKMVVDMFMSKSKTIFSTDFMRDVQSVNGFCRPKYKLDNLQYVLDEFFGEKKLGDVLVHIVIPSYCISTKCTKIFSSLNPEDYSIKLSDAIAASCACPTKFSPKEIYGRYYIDGGIAANNPSSAAYPIVLENLNLIENDLNIMSVGCGSSSKVFNVDKLKGAGVLGWMDDILSIIFDASDDIIDQGMKNIFEERYLRIQPNRPSFVSNDIDNASDENLKKLIVFGTSMYSEYYSETERLFSS